MEWSDGVEASIGRFHPGYVPTPLSFSANSIALFFLYISIQSICWLWLYTSLWTIQSSLVLLECIQSCVEGRGGWKRLIKQTISFFSPEKIKINWSFFSYFCYRDTQEHVFKVHINKNWLQLRQQQVFQKVSNSNFRQLVNEMGCVSRQHWS